MSDQSNFMLNLSVLYRNTQKYFDRMLAPYDIGSGQLTFLLVINENEGITMQEVTRVGEVDKGTTTKSIQRLIDQGYIQTRTDEKDRRVKRLYMTRKGADIMRDVYEVRNRCRSLLASGMDFDRFEEMLEQACGNARSSLQPAVSEQIRIGGIQRSTLVDYPGKLACTIFTAGCSFKCPYCHNKDLVFIPERYEYLNVDEIMDYLHRRKGLLDGVCISGGEPLMQEGLIPFLQMIKDEGYLIKLDTNGYYPDRLKEIVEDQLVDYVAMDIKNSASGYAEAAGLGKDAVNMDLINESIDYLLEGHVEYEFRTTVVKELHDVGKIREIAERIRNAQHYYLQQYVDSENVIQPGYHSFDRAEMDELLAAAREFVPSAGLRGIGED